MSTLDKTESLTEHEHALPELNPATQNDAIKLITSGNAKTYSLDPLLTTLYKDCLISGFYQLPQIWPKNNWLYPTRFLIALKQHW